MKITVLLVLMALVAPSALKAQQNSAHLSNAVDSVSYSLGISIGNSLKQNGLKEINSRALQMAIDEVFAGKTTLIQEEQANMLLSAYFMKLHEAQLEEEKLAGKKYLEDNGKLAGVVTLPSGLQYKVIKDGVGSSPASTDTVVCHYKGSLLDGTVFDDSNERGEPIEFPVNQVIPGWTEVLQLMKPGSKWLVYLPSELGYGSQGAGEVIPPNSVLIFEIELISVKKSQ